MRALMRYSRQKPTQKRPGKSCCVCYGRRRGGGVADAAARCTRGLIDVWSG